MRFWDSSTIVPLLVDEPVSGQMETHLGEDSIVAWWGTPVECLSAIARREREGVIDSEESARARAKLSALVQEWIEIPPTERVRMIAARLLRLHTLRAGDAFQLAAATIARDEETLTIMTLDDPLAVAARREGFAVLP